MFFQIDMPFSNFSVSGKLLDPELNPQVRLRITDVENDIVFPISLVAVEGIHGGVFSLLVDC